MHGINAHQNKDRGPNRKFLKNRIKTIFKMAGGMLSYFQNGSDLSLSHMESLSKEDFCKINLNLRDKIPKVLAQSLN